MVYKNEHLGPQTVTVYYSMHVCSGCDHVKVCYVRV